MKFINIHTHKYAFDNSSILNIFPENTDKIEDDKLYSIGIHPWEVCKINVEKQLRIVNEFIKKENVVAIGEIGLDRFREDFEGQKRVFIKQIKIAEENKKPIIIHCVKAFSELQEVLKKEKPNVPIIIHRYSGNKTIAEQLLKFGCYLSFGHELFNPKSKIQKLFKHIPTENVFLETDDSELNIEEIYKKASELKELSVKNLAEILMINYKKCFNR